MPKCTICRGPVATPKKVAVWMETHLKRIDTDTSKPSSGGVNYAERAGGLRAIIEITMSALRGVCHRHISDEKKEPS